MRDLYLKRNELNEKSQKLRSAKFDEKLKREQVTEIIEQQEEIYKRFKFYDNYIKIGGKLNGKKIRA